MKYFTLIATAFLLTSSVLASDLLTCDRIGDGKGPHSLSIKITKNTVVITDLDRSVSKPQVWNREDPGLYSYWGTDSSKMNTSNEEFIDHVRFDIEDRKTLADIRAKSTFQMEIAFIWESLDFDSSGLLSEDMYSCKKI